MASTNTPATRATTPCPGCWAAAAPPTEPTCRAPLGAVLGARSGDKGGNANIGLWARDDAGYAWVREHLTVERLRGLLGPQTRGYELAFTEGDGTRLAMRVLPRRGNRVFSAQHLLDLPGTTLVLRVDSWRGTPDLFPNVLTALVAALSCPPSPPGVRRI